MSLYVVINKEFWMNVELRNHFANLEIFQLLRALSTTPFDDKFCQTMAVAISVLKDRYREINETIHIEMPDYWSSSTEDEIDSFIRLNKGIKRNMGHGSFAYAYEGIDGFVYKMNIREPKYDSFIDYAHISLNEHNFLMPKVEDIKVHDFSYCCKIEKLKEIKIEDFNAHWLPLSNSLKRKNINDFCNIVLTKNDLPKEQAVQWAEKVFEIQEQTKANIDIRSDNILSRNGQWVLNDPLAFGQSSGKYQFNC